MGHIMYEQEYVLKGTVSMCLCGDSMQWNIRMVIETDTF